MDIAVSHTVGGRRLGRIREKRGDDAATTRTSRTTQREEGVAQASDIQSTTVYDLPLLDFDLRPQTVTG